ncbi:MAG: cupin domain-containing protein [Bryobacterales bacterium]|nr:cupin domain-containing protein [Bryobacterales bacterium]
MQDRRFFFAMASAAVGATMAPGGTPGAQAAIGAAVKTGGKAEKLEHTFGVQHIYYQGPTNELSVFEGGSLRLKPGMEPHPPHKHPEEEIMLVTEGSGEIYVQGDVTQVGPGSMMYTNANELHGIKCTGAEPLLFYYFKWLKS